MRARFDTLFGRLFGVLFVAIVLAHLLAFTWFRLYGPPPRHRNLLTVPRANSRHPIRVTRPAHRGHGSVAQWCR